MNTFIKQILVVTAFLSLLLFFIILALKIVFSQPYLEFIYSFDSIKSDSQFIYPYSFRLEYAKKTLNLILNNDLEIEDFFFTQKEINHLRDVRELLKRLFLLQYIAFFLAILTLIFLYFYYEKSTIRMITLMMSFFKIYIIIFLIFSIFSLIFFKTFFNLLHRPFFQEKSWIFEKESLIIQLFPSNFWYLGYMFYLIILESIFLFYFIMLKYLKTMKSATSIMVMSKGK